MTGPAASADEPLDVHDAVLADYDDHQDGRLAPARRAEVDAHLAGCEPCRRAYAELGGTVSALAGLGKQRAPDLGAQVAQTIHRRSGGRFFGPRTLGDRVPFVLLAVLGLALAAAAAWLARSSGTGSLAPPERQAPSTPRPEPGSVVPRPVP